MIIYKFSPSYWERGWNSFAGSTSIGQIFLVWIPSCFTRSIGISFMVGLFITLMLLWSWRVLIVCQENLTREGNPNTGC